MRKTKTIAISLLSATATLAVIAVALNSLTTGLVI